MPARVEGQGDAVPLPIGYDVVPYIVHGILLHIPLPGYVIRVEVLGAMTNWENWGYGCRCSASLQTSFVAGGKNTKSAPGYPVQNCTNPEEVRQRALVTTAISKSQCAKPCDLCGACRIPLYRRSSAG